MEALLLQDGAYVSERYEILQEKRREGSKRGDKQSGDGNGDAGREIPDQERQELERWRIVERAKALDAKGPTSQLKKKFSVLHEILEKLYAPNGDIGGITSPSNGALKRLEMGDSNAPVLFKELPLPTQVVLKMFFRTCQSLKDPAKLAANSRLSVQIASKLPSILTSMSSCVLSPGMADDSTVELDSGDNVGSVFYQLFCLFEALLGVSDEELEDRNSVKSASLRLSVSDRATVIVAFVALSLKWGRLGYLLKGVKLLLENEEVLREERFEPLVPLFRELAAAAIERPQVAFGEEEQLCGYLMSFGKGDHGKLGHGQCVHVSCQEGNCTENKMVPTMVAATRDVLFSKIDSLSTHSIAITTKGEAMAWGNGDKYRLGHGSSSKEYTPRNIEFLTLKGRVRDLACGLGHTLALMESGELFAWGNGSNGRLGLGDTNDRSSPTKVVIPASAEKQGVEKKEEGTDVNVPTNSPVRFKHVFCGASHSLGLAWDGKAYAWGKNNQGQCGHGHTNDQWTIQEIESFRGDEEGMEAEFVVFAAGGWEHTLFCTGSGRVYSCGCGYKDSRRAGIPPVLGHGDCDRRLKPTLVQTLDDAREEIVKVACGWDHSLAVSSTGKVYTWGSGTNGKLGHGDEESFDIPTLVRNMEGKPVKDAKAGCEHTVFLTRDNELWTCGQGDSGRLGHGDNQTRKRPTKIELFAECGLKPVALAVGDKYNLVLVEDAERQYDGDRGGDSTHKPKHWTTNSSSGHKANHGATNAHLSRHRAVQPKKYKNTHPMQFGAHWVLSVAAGSQTERNPETNHVSLSKGDFIPDSYSAVALFIVGHLDRLASDYIVEEGDKLPEKRQEPSAPEASSGVQLTLLSFGVDTSCESFDALLQLLRWITSSSVCVEDKSARSEKQGSDESNCLKSQERMGVVISCLRILQLNLMKSLELTPIMAQNIGKTSKVLSKHSSLLSLIHELLDSLSGRNGDKVFGGLYDRARRSVDKLDVQAVAGAISREAAYALKMGFGLFYPSVSARLNLLCEVLGDHKVDVPSMRTVILSDQLCMDSIMTEILKASSLTDPTSDVPTHTQNESSAGKANFDIKSLMIALLKRSSTEAIQNLDNEAFADFANEPDCFLRLLHVLQTHYFSIVYQSAFQQHRSKERNNPASATIATFLQGRECLLQYVDALMADALVVLKRLHKGSRQHEEIITWRLNGSFFHSLLPNALECLSLLLSSQQDTTDNLQFVERILPNLVIMLKMLDEVSWKMHSAGDEGNQANNESMPGVLHNSASLSQERNWFVDLGDACAVLCGKLCCELFYSSTQSNISADGSSQHGAYYFLILSEGSFYHAAQDIPSKASEVSSNVVLKILEWERLGVFEVEDELVGCTVEPKSSGSTSTSRAESGRFLLQLSETDLLNRSISFWGWIASMLSHSIDIRVDMQHLLATIVSVSSWHLGLTEELREVYKLYEADRQHQHPTDRSCVSTSGKLWEIFAILLEVANNFQSTGIVDTATVAHQSRLLLSLRPNPALVPHELRWGINLNGKCFCHPRTLGSISNLIEFLTKPVDTDHIQRILFSKERDAALRRTGISILHDLLRKLTTSSVKSCLLEEFVTVASTTNQMKSVAVGSTRKINLVYEQDNEIAKPLENLFVRFSRIISSEDGSFELKKKALLAWTIPLGFKRENIHSIVALIAKSGIMSNLVDLLMDEANVLETHSDINFHLSENHAGGEKWPSRIAVIDSKLPSKMSPITEVLFDQTPTQMISFLAWEAFYAVSMLLGKSEQFMQHRPNLFLQFNGSSFNEKELLTPRSTSMSPRRRLTLPKKMVVSTVDESIEHMMDGLFLMLKGVKNRIDALDSSAEEYSSLVKCFSVNCKGAEVRVQQQQNSQVFLCGHPVQVSQTNAHDIRISHSKRVISACDSVSGLTLSFWLYVEHTGALESKPLADGTFTNLRLNESLVQLIGFSGNQDTTKINEPTDTHKGPELIVFTRDPHPEHVSIGLSLKYQEDSKESWYTILVDNHLARRKWIQIVFGFSQGSPDLFQVFVGGKRATTNMSQRAGVCSDIIFSQLSEKWGSWDLISAGGNVDMRFLNIHEDKLTNYSPAVLPKRANHNNFAAIMDDVILTCGTLTEEEVLRMQHSGNLLFRLKQQHIAECHCSKILSLLCQLVGEGCPKSSESSLDKLPFTNRWITLFTSMVLTTCRDQDLDQVYLCHLLQDVLPRTHLTELNVQDLGQILFRFRPGLISKVEHMFNVFNNESNIPSTSILRRQNEVLYEAMKQHGILHSNYGGEHMSENWSLYVEMAIDAVPLQTKASVRLAAGVHLLQKLCTADVWRNRLEKFVGHTIGELRSFVSLTELKNTQELAHLRTVINTMAGYSEEVLNGQRASFRDTRRLISQFQGCFPFDSVLHFDDSSIEHVAKVQSFVFRVLKDEIRRTICLPARNEILSRCHNDVVAVKEIDLQTVSVLHLRTQVLRILVATLLREDTSAMTNKSWIRYLLEDSAACSDLLQVAASCVKECVTANLSPDSKVAMRLRRLRVFNREVLGGSKHRRHMITTVSLGELERLQWRVWEELSSFLPSVSQIPWWQQNAVAKGKLALEAVGGEVELCDLKVKALEHFPTVRLAQANICANSGLWFFEVVVLTDGLMQIGYVDGDFTADPLQGQGVGDHTNSWAFDGFRCKKWNVSSYDYGEQWKVDDIVGVLLDTDRMEISYLLNGKFLGVAFSGIPITSSSRMCPAASLNVHQSASFNFGATSTSSAGEEGLQPLSVAGFKHLPALDTEDQTRFRPVILSLQPRQGTKVDEALNLNGAEKTETKLDDVTNNWSSSSDDESDTDDGEIVMENSENLSVLFQSTLETGSRDGHEPRAAHQTGENGQHRQDLIEGLTGLGFSLAWATRCATETRLPVDEASAVAWILEQMEKVGLDRTTSLSANSTFNDDGLENQGQPNTLWSTRAHLTNVVDNHSDDLAAESSSLAIPNLAEAINEIQCTSTSDLQTNQIPDIPVFQQSGTSEKRGIVPASWINAYIEADKKNQQSDNEDVFQHFHSQRQTDLLTSLQLSDENQPMSTSRTDKEALDRKRNVDDLIPLGAAVDTTVSVAYARQAFTTLLLQASRQNEQSSTYAMVRGLILNEDSSSNLYRFLRIALGLDALDPAFEFKSNYDQFCSERSLPIQKAMLTLLIHEAHHDSDQTASTDLPFERSPLLKSLCQEISTSCDQGANLGKNKQGNKRFADSVATNSAAAWFAWVSGLVLAFVERRLGDELSSPNAIFEIVLSTTDVPLFYNTSFVDKLVSIASSPGSSTSSWKYVSFRLLCRIMSVVRMCERESSSLSLDAPPDYLSSSALSAAVQLPKLIELFTLRHRREMYDKVFFSDSTSTLFALLVRSTFTFGRLNTFKATPKSCINLEVNNYSSTHVSISWEQANEAILPVPLIEGFPDDSSLESTCDVKTDIVFLKVKRYGPSLGCELPDTWDIISSKALPSKGAFNIRNLLPDTQYLLQLRQSDNSATSTNIDTDFNGTEVIVQTLREPVFELDEDTMGKNLVVLNRNLSAKNTVNKKWHSVRASVAFEEGVHQWQVRLDNCVSKNIFIGVCTADASMENYIGSDAYGYGFLANKAVWHNKAKLHSYGEIFKQGDVIQVTLDCNAKTLAFSRNGEHLGIAASNLRAGSNRPGVGSNTSTDGSCKWYPAFSMYNKDDKLTLVPPPTASVLSSQQGRPQNASTFELIDNMHDVLAYQLPHADSDANHTCSRLFEKAFEAFQAWRREEKVFREIALGQVIVIDKSKTATEIYGLEAGDSVFTSKGQCTVVGEYRHELWYEVDDGGRASLFGTITPQLFSWSLSACRDILSSPDEYPVHRHHKHKLDLDSSVTESQTSDDSTGLDSKVNQEGISFQDFIAAQKSWGRNGIDTAEADAILIAELDTIAASQASSSPFLLSFADVSTALLLERLYDTHGISAEHGSNQTIARIGLLLYVNTCLYNVVRLAMPRNTFVTSLGSCLSPDTITNQPSSSKQKDIFCNSEYHLVSPVAALLNSPYWALNDPSNFTQISSLAARLLFSSQKEKLIDEELRRTKTPNRATDSLQERSDSDDSGLESDLPTIMICFPAFEAAPFWEMTCAVSKQQRFYLPALALTGESIFVQFSKQLAAQDARQWRHESSQPFEAVPVSQSFQVHVENSPTRSCGVAVKDDEQSNMAQGQQSEDEEESPLQQPSSKQTTTYLRLFERAVREVQSAHFPLFVPADFSRACTGLSDHDIRRVLQLDINTELFSPSALAQSTVRSSQLMLWYFCFGQLLGIAWRSKILLPLQFISKSFWKELVDPTQAVTEGDQEHRSRVRSNAIRAIRDGLFSIIPSQCVALLSGNNRSLRDRLSDLDVSYIERLEIHATYSVPRQSHHDLFWKIVKDFTSVERHMLEQFINPERRNGTKQIEISPFVLEIADALTDGRDHPDSCYPVVVPIGPNLSRLHLPSYSSPHTLRHKLILAMTNIPFM